MEQVSEAVSKMRVSQSGTDLVFVRPFKALPEQVFQAWTQPQLLTQWWGPHHFSNHDCKIDLKAGGQWGIVMRAPDGKDYPCVGFYLEVSPPHKLVWTDLSHDMPNDWIDKLNQYRQGEPGDTELKIITTAEFMADGEGTQLTLTSHFANVADRDAIIQMGAVEGWAQSLERLDTVLAG